eukprot:jgi/Ulvmu1/1718/UM116_0032.1
MQPNSFSRLTAAFRSESKGTSSADNGGCQSYAARDDGFEQSLAPVRSANHTRNVPLTTHTHMLLNGSRAHDQVRQEMASAASDTSHRMSGEVALELSPPARLSGDLVMCGQDFRPGSPSPPISSTNFIPSDCQRPTKLLRQGSVRASSMAQSITYFFRRAQPASNEPCVEVAHVKPAEAQSCNALSKKRRLGHLQSNPSQRSDCTAPSSNGLIAMGVQPRPAGRIPGVFKAKRVLDTQVDAKHWKNVTRPTLATTVFAGSAPHLRLPVEDEAENYAITSTMQSAFDTGGGEASLKHAQMFPHVAMPADSDSLVPCGMAPDVASPTTSDRLPRRWTRTGKEEARRTSLQAHHLCTPAQSAAEGQQHDAALGSVHTPPELPLSAVLECPGAPVKRRADTDAVDVFSRLSSLSVDSLDMCDSPFAPGAPAWSPRADVRRALRFD